MYVSKVNKGFSFKGNVVAMVVGQKTANEELVSLYPNFFEKVEDEKSEVVSPTIVETTAPKLDEVRDGEVDVIDNPPVNTTEEKVDLTDEIQALADQVEVKEVKETKTGFKLFGKRK